MGDSKQVVNFERLNHDLDTLRRSFTLARPFRHVVIDGFADPGALMELVGEIPDAQEAGIGRSRDYMFARNKFEKSNFATFGRMSRELYAELCCDRFRDLVCGITDEDVFIDPTFHGGGLHQGGEAAYLDMHVDFNTHPLHKTWFRNLNILLYLNPGWKSSWQGSLQLRHKSTGDEAFIEPLFNRCVIMETRAFTLHGFAPIRFPTGVYRRSIACYAYTEMPEEFGHRSTVWYPQQGGIAKRAFGRAWPTLVRVKNRFMGSGTTKN